MICRLFLLGTILILISACGIKPGSLDAPEGSQSTFPHTYPSTETDPK